MVMTIEVYRIGRDGRRTEVVPRYEVGTGDPERLQPDPLGMPPCSCPRCRERRVARR